MSAAKDERHGFPNAAVVLGDLYLFEVKESIPVFAAIVPNPITIDLLGLCDFPMSHV